MADTLCTAHAILRDRYSRCALALDVSLLAATVWLTAMVFVDPAIASKLTPFGLEPELWVGLLGVGASFLSVLQLKVDWKNRSDQHNRSLRLYAGVKRESGYVLSKGEPYDPAECQRVLDRYDLASEAAVPVPERDFLRLKRRHLLKVAASRYLDQHPGTVVWLLKLRLLLRDNFGARGA